MAIVRIPEQQRTIRGVEPIAECLRGIGIDYEVWEPKHAVSPEAPQEEVLNAYKDEIERLKASGGYAVADVISVSSATPNLDAMMSKFNREHWHDEDEVRFIIHGRGLFHVRPTAGPVTSIEVESGDLIRVPRGTLHWFDLCASREIRAIRLFQDPAGWTPQYTGTGIDAKYETVCFGAPNI